MPHRTQTLDIAAELTKEADRTPNDVALVRSCAVKDRRPTGNSTPAVSAGYRIDSERAGRWLPEAHSDEDSTVDCVEPSEIIDRLVVPHHIPVSVMP
eukprot:2718421-Rhodomonas_salina.2